MNKFYEVTAQLEQALNGISYENLDISDEVKEQVEACIQIVIFLECNYLGLHMIVLFLSLCFILVCSWCLPLATCLILTVEVLI